MSSIGCHGQTQFSKFQSTPCDNREKRLRCESESHQKYDLELAGTYFATNVHLRKAAESGENNMIKRRTNYKCIHINILNFLIWYGTITIWKMLRRWYFVQNTNDSSMHTLTCTYVGSGGNRCVHTNTQSSPGNNCLPHARLRFNMWPRRFDTD